MRTILLKKKDH